MKRTLIFLFIITISLCAISCGEDSGDSTNRSLEERVGSLEKQIVNLVSDEYRKVIVEKLNIRKTAKPDSEVLAIAQKNTYLRTINKFDGRILIEFHIDNIPFIGYISADKRFSQIERITKGNEASSLKQGLIKILWEQEVKKELESMACGLPGLYIDTSNSTLKNKIRNHLVKYFRSHEIYLKPISAFRENSVAYTSREESVCSIIAVQVEENRGKSTVNIQLFGSNEIIYFSTSIPFDGSTFN